MRSLKFTLRDLLWLVVVVALCLGWAVDHKRIDDKWRKEWFRVAHELNNAGIAIRASGFAIDVVNARLAPLNPTEPQTDPITESQPTDIEQQ